jgi:hypothetical protein
MTVKFGFGENWLKFAADVGSVRLALLLIPIIVFVLGIVQLHYLQPFYAGISYFGPDPSYVYLFNGLCIIKGLVPGHLDHPGTPVQILTGAVILVRWAISRVLGFENDGVAISVLKEPEAYLAFIAYVLLLLHSASNFYLGHKVARASGNVLYGLAVQSWPLFLGVQMPRILYLSAEAGLLLVSTLLVAVLSDLFFRAHDAHRSASSHYQIAIKAGVLCGLGLAVKISFFPMFALLLALGSFRAFARAMMGLVVAFLIGILPVIGDLSTSIAWWGQIATHTGYYGYGELGLVDFSYLPGKFLLLSRAYPVLLVSLAALALLLLWIVSRRWRTDTKTKMPLLPLAASIMLAEGGQLAIVLKHFSPHYFLPALPAVLFSIVWITWLIEQRHKNLRWVLLVLAIVLAVFSSGQTWATQSELMQPARARTIVISVLANAIGRYRNPIVISAYGVSTPAFAIQLGLIYTVFRRYQRHLWSADDTPIPWRPSSVLFGSQRLRPNEFVFFNNWLYQQGLPGEGYPLSRVNDFISQGFTVLLVYYEEKTDLSLSRFKFATVAEIGALKVARVYGAIPLE